MWKNQNVSNGGDFLKNIAKDEKVMINNYDAAHKLLNMQESKRKYATFRSKIDLFFIDHEFVPLLVQEGYLNSFGPRDTMDDLEKMAEAADQISISDQLNIKIRTEQNWSLLPNYGILSSVGPCILANGTTGYPGFPQWLGKNSSARKAKRLIRELKQKMTESISANQYAIQHEVIPFLLGDILQMLQAGRI